MMSRSYYELSLLPTFEERFEYLRLQGVVGRETFGYDRYMNQRFYKSSEWKRQRNNAIIRDHGSDLGILDRPIHDRLYIHHINPMRPEDFTQGNPMVLDLDNLITVSFDTHQAIHYGNASNLRSNKPIVRTPGDTDSW